MTDVRAQVKSDTPPFAFNPADAEFRRDPYPRYDELREDPKLARTEEGMWVLTRHADVLAAVRDPRLSSHPRHAEGRRDRHALPSSPEPAAATPRAAGRNSASVAAERERGRRTRRYRALCTRAGSIRVAERHRQPV